MRIISTSTVSIKSPRQVSSSSCLRTAGVGSTGVSAAKFISSGVASVASASVQPVASASVASRSAFSQLRPASVELRSSSRVVSSVASASGIVASASSPVAYLGWLLRRSSPTLGSALSSPRVCVTSRVVVASGSVSLGSVASRSVQLRQSSQCPRTALRSVLLRLSEVARGDLSKRMSRRFAHPEVASVQVASSAERFSASGICSSESCASESSVLGVPSSVRVPECSASPARAWRFH